MKKVTPNGEKKQMAKILKSAAEYIDAAVGDLEEAVEVGTKIKYDTGKLQKHMSNLSSVHLEITADAKALEA